MSDCGHVRDRLLEASPSGDVLDHLRDCPACSRYAGRARALRDGMRDHHAGVQPDAGFAGRVAARVRQQPERLLGWAATRLLPASLAVMLVLAWFAAQGSTGDGTTVAENVGSDDVLSWVLEDDGGEW